jgi:hypothetical protein
VPRIAVAGANRNALRHAWYDAVLFPKDEIRPAIELLGACDAAVRPNEHIVVRKLGLCGPERAADAVSSQSLSKSNRITAIPLDAEFCEGWNLSTGKRGNPQERLPGDRIQSPKSRYGRRINRRNFIGLEQIPLSPQNDS